MRVPRRFSAVLLFAAAGMLALVLSGLMDWITSVLFLAMESLVGGFRPLVGQARSRGGRHRAPGRLRVAAGPRAPWKERPRRPGRGRKSPRGRAGGEPSGGGTDPEGRPPVRILVPIHGARPVLIDFALEECRSRRAELLVLFLRPLAVLPMGPSALPGLAEDEPARAALEAVAEQARDTGVPLRTLYEVSRDMPATILDVVRTHQVDVLVMEATRRGLLWRALLGDQVRSVLMHLPERVSLLIHS
jgi:nucleotide-binding universal stress UspA family protein